MLKNKIYFLFGILLIIGCSTNKNTWLSRNYHNLSAHYNVYFNGKESLKAGIAAIEKANKDDYTQVLTVFPDSKESSKDVASGEMDVALKKGAKLVKVHSIRKKPKKKDGDHSVQYEKFYSQNEFNKWVDNAYLMMGKANFYKHEYITAQQSFNYIFREFRVGPEWYEAEIFSVRVALERGDFSTAKMLLDNYNIEGKAPDDLNGLFAATYADYYLKQKMYEESVPFLESAAKNAWSRYYNIRLNFILAQVYHKLNRYKDASLTYKKVIKLNPSYEMAFNAKVNRASVVFGEGGLPAVQKEVAKLLRDARNKEYQDQIYYAMAKAYQVENMESEAVDNYKISVSKSTNNAFQKSLSFYELAKIYYEKPKYRTTYYFLDSALVGFTQEYQYYEDVKGLHEDLSDLVININNVEREDSLQRIAAMSDADRIVFIEQLIKKEKDRQEEQKRLESLKSEGDFFAENAYNASSSSSSGKWYFYNESAMGMGKLEFQKRWGTRKLEDNWRRSNKEVVVEDLTEMDESDLPGFHDVKKDSLNLQDSLMVDGAADKKEESKDLLIPETYLKDLPLTNEKLAKSNSIIEESLISMGIIYKDELENIPFAIKAFEELIRRFPQSKYLEDALMNLYVCYELQDNNTQMQAVRKQLEDKFPDGDFTHYLNDPEFFVKREERLKRIEEKYQIAYSDYLSNDFKSPIEKYKEVETIDKESELLPKFKFLAGLSYAKTGDYDHFENELTVLVNDYPGNEVTPVAKEILNQYHKGRKPTIGASSSKLNDLRDKQLMAETGIDRKEKGDANAFVVDNNSVHSLIVLFNKEADFNRLRYNIADYNFSKFLLNDYEMTDYRLPDGSPVFVITGFKNRIEAMDYFYSIRQREDLFQVANMDKYQLYAVNEKNFKHLLSSGDLVGYDSFFVENYMSAEAVKKMEEENRQKEESKTNKEVLKENDKKEIVPSETKLEEAQNTQQDLDKKEVGVVEKPENIVEKQSNSDKTKEGVVIAEENQINDVKNNKEEVTVSEQKEEKVSNAIRFVYTEGPHSAMVLFKKGRINIQQIGKVFTNYTKNTFSPELKVDFGPKSTGYFYVKVSGFKTAADAKIYLSKVEKDSYLMRDISRMQPYFWIITESNYSLLNDEESFTLYNDFYKANY